jgi:hypothetical protein
MAIMNEASLPRSTICNRVEEPRPRIDARKVVMYIRKFETTKTTVSLSIECLFQCSFFHELTIFTSHAFFFFSLSFVHKNIYMQCTYTICRHIYFSHLFSDTMRQNEHSKQSYLGDPDHTQISDPRRSDGDDDWSRLC